ncbi:MAG: asparaginase [Cocleimonas sp.]|nr:asparaginase [Cocleimonas sp.]
MRNNPSIKLLVTGGTIDKVYNELTGDLVFTQSHLPEMLAQGHCKADINIETLMLKDSLEMKGADRELILQACQQSNESLIIITHGTDTMTLTASHLAPQISDKTIVLLGAMIPYAFKQSDSLFNLGCAISAVQCLSSGVYITMNGKVFAWDQVVKNRQQGLFESTYNKNSGG